MNDKLTFNSFQEIMEHNIRSFCKSNDLCLVEINYNEQYFTILTSENDYETMKFGEIYNRRNNTSTNHTDGAIDVVGDGITDITDLLNSCKRILIRKGYHIRVVNDKYVVEKSTNNQWDGD